MIFRKGVYVPFQSKEDFAFHRAQEMIFELDKSPHEAEKNLIEEGIDEDTAITLVQQLVAKKQALEKQMLNGVYWFVGGVLFTAISYSLASPGATALVSWGATVYGALEFFSGFNQT